MGRKAKPRTCRAHAQLTGFYQETKFENASELYEKAGIAYKTGKCWNDAGDAYTRLSECCAALGQQGDAAAKLKEVPTLHSPPTRLVATHIGRQKTAMQRKAAVTLSA